MRKRKIMIMTCVVMSIFMLGCSKQKEKDDNGGNNDVTSEENVTEEQATTGTEENTTENTTENSDKEKELKVKNTLSDAFEEIFTKDYSNGVSKEIKNFINENFTINGADLMNEKLKGYGKISYSDFNVTKVKQAKPIAGPDYKSTYEVEYNITIESSKPTVYSGLKATLIELENGEIVIDSIDENNF